MLAMTRRIAWDGTTVTDAVNILAADGGLVVTPTKVGYILIATDGAGLERKFEAKQRNRGKPGVVLCASLAQLAELAELNDEIAEFYRKHWDADILLGCILPWQPEALALLPDETAADLARDGRGTSCFVIRFGTPAEQIVGELWREHRRLSFASSANPSGIGNKGRVEGIGDRIEDAADLIVTADDYVRSIQPDRDDASRHEQGVMVSMVDRDGTLVPQQDRRRLVSPAPTVIRRGLDIDRIMENLGESFPSWDYRHGDYY
ncbi:L-threonylcarbamoyladenylate synthase [Nocardia coffeae]|uniref:L-threonylcarbamoyladenylate synthase n=1 Tax=Nocardia coffeae TaxID=2873381 RepID=UPI001F28B79D|nr:Sua5/YciO/YrdC/YwlC family protein [Nocardia coffeae]